MELKKIIPRVFSVILLAWWAFFVFLAHGFQVLSLFEWIFVVVLLIVTCVSWKFDFLGGSMFIFWGLFYLLIGLGRASVTGILIVPVPLLIAGGLFLFAGWRGAKK